MVDWLDVPEKSSRIDRLAWHGNRSLFRSSVASSGGRLECKTVLGKVEVMGKYFKDIRFNLLILDR